jgi:hypothetical protein
MIEILSCYTRAKVYTSATAQTIKEAVIEGLRGGADLRGAKTDRLVLTIIGCHIKTIVAWLADYQEIGHAAGYSEAEIAEYGGHLTRIDVALKALIEAGHAS